MKNTADKTEPGYALSFALIAGIVVPQVASLEWGLLDGNRGTPIMLAGVYLIFLGSAFLASYYYSHKAFFLRRLMWFCEYLSYPASRKMAFFYFALATLIKTGVQNRGQSRLFARACKAGACKTGTESTFALQCCCGSNAFQSPQHRCNSAWRTCAGKSTLTPVSDHGFDQCAGSPVRRRLSKFATSWGSSGKPSIRVVYARNWSGAMPPRRGSLTTGQIA